MGNNGSNAINLGVYAARTIDQEEYFAQGHKGCTGCVPALTLRQVLKATGGDVVVSNCTGCMEIISSAYPETSWRVPWIHVAFETSASVAAGMDSGIQALKRKGKMPKDKPIKVIAFGGDGGTGDIGLQALSGALERGHNMIYVCYDNEAYMNTGIQRSGLTPFGAWTTTSPSGVKSIGQSTWKKDLVAICAAHNIPYVATACPSYPFDLIKKVQFAMNINGPAYLHIYSPCPTGWRSDPKDGIKLGRMVVKSGIFPLYEIINGYYRLSYDPDKLDPIDDYLKLQGRFRHLKEDSIKEIQGIVVDKYNRLKERCEFDQRYFAKLEEEKAKEIKKEEKSTFKV